eukprot:TRINITY_DN33089_c0_g1_i1.p1 TRINITY_DN33089_c0_g1~~TRINITY_DN33089_c0_g1_i1.p1  ORF type:complete len:306 (-),score=59.76 TRINITY_DN33089_c0_g1_i1:256-1173(-)
MNQDSSLSGRLGSSAAHTLQQVDPRSAAEDAVAMLNTYCFRGRVATQPSEQLTDATLALGVLDALCGADSGVGDTPISLPAASPSRGTQPGRSPSPGSPGFWSSRTQRSLPVHTSTAPSPKRHSPPRMAQSPGLSALGTYHEQPSRDVEQSSAVAGLQAQISALTSRLEYSEQRRNAENKVHKSQVHELTSHINRLAAQLECLSTQHEHTSSELHSTLAQLQHVQAQINPARPAVSMGVDAEELMRSNRTSRSGHSDPSKVGDTLNPNVAVEVRKAFERIIDLRDSENHGLVTEDELRRAMTSFE